MTQPLSDTDRVAAALHVYADAVKLGQLPIPHYITTHATNIGFRTFMTWADNLGLPIDIITSEATDNAYGRIMIPADPAGLLPDYVTLRITATSERLTDARHADIATHNAQCTPIDLVPEEINRYSGGF